MKLQNLKKYLDENSKLSAEGKLREVLEKFYKSMASDLMIGFFFQGKDLDKIIDGQVKLLMMVMGYPKKYDGKPVAQVHDEIAPILLGHFNRRMILLEKTLADSSLPEAAQKEWVGFEKQFENVVVSS